MSDKYIFNSKLTEEEIDNNFKDFDFFSSLEEGLKEALSFEKGKSSAETFSRKCSLPNINVSELRADLFMTQKKFADLLGVSSRTVEAWECGRSTPTPTARILMKLISDDHSLVSKLQSE